MKYEDLSFEMINDDGMEVVCDIIAVVPNPDDSENPYVIYTDYTLDNEENFKNYYGQITLENGKTVLRRITDDEIIRRIILMSNDEVVKSVNEQIQDNLS